MIGYYDFVLGLVPVSLLGVSGALLAAGLDLAVAVPLAGAIAAGVIGHGLFVNAPVDGRPAAEAPGVAAD